MTQQQSEGNNVLKTNKLIMVLALSVLAGLAVTQWQRCELGIKQGDGEAFRVLQLQDENGVIPTDGWAAGFDTITSMPVSPEDWQEFWQEQQTIPAPPPLNWVSIGPNDIGGRINSLVIHPSGGRLLAAAATGGIWKSTDEGTSWSTNTDFALNLNISSLIAHPGIADTMYAGTGGFTNLGDGIYKSSDGGESWHQLPFTHRNPDFQPVNRVLMTQRLSLLAGSNRGVFRSIDGGVTWHRTVGIEQASEIEESPDGTALLASDGTRIFNSTDDGIRWTQTKWEPSTGSGKIKLAYAPSDSSVVYAQTAHKSGTLYRSTDGGVNWRIRSSCCTSCLFYTSALWVAPWDPDTVVFGGARISRSTDGGLTSVYVGSPHEDHHVLISDPREPRRVYCGTDGGIFQTHDIMNIPNPPPPISVSLVEWESLNNGLSVTQFYAAGVSSFNGTILGGTQDNGVLRLTTEEPWEYILAGDGGPVANDMGGYWYFSTQNLGLFRTHSEGYTYQFIGTNLPHECGGGSTCSNFIAPFIIDPNNPLRLFAGGNKLWRCPNSRDPVNNMIWETIKPVTTPIESYISAIAVTPSNSNQVWVGHNNGSVFRTYNGTDPSPTWTQLSLFPHRQITRIAVGPSYTYVALGGFASGNLWRYDGTLWTDISGLLPRIPIYSIAPSPNYPNVVYIGTEIGVFASSTAGNTWSPGNRGPANTPVMDMFWMGNKLTAVTFGRGIFTLTPSIEHR